VTAKYQSLNVAKKSGYSILADTAGITCIAEPQMGAMGVHYVKGEMPHGQKLWSTHLINVAGCTWPLWSTW
jgi:hypothetical protein